MIAAAALAGWSVIRAAASQYRSIVVSEVQYLGTGDWVELYNPGSSPLALTGWQLLTAQGSQPLSLTIGATGFAVIAPPLGLADTGGYVRLMAGGGLSVDAMSYGTDTSICVSPAQAQPGESLQLIALDAAECSFVSAPPSPLQGPAPTPTSTPTATATPTETATPEPTPTVATGAVLFTEVSYLGSCAQEWLELANLSPATVQLDGWPLADNYGSAPLTLSLGPGQVVVVGGRDWQPEIGCLGVAHLLAGSCIGNGLANEGDSLRLLDATGRLIDSMTYGGALSASPGQTLARFLSDAGDLAGWQLSAPAPGCLQSEPVPTPRPTPAPQSTPAQTSTLIPATLQPTPIPTSTPIPAPVQQAQYLSYLPISSRGASHPTPLALGISEVLYQGTTADEGDEFVELRNFTPNPVSLAGYKLGDAETRGDAEGMYLFPSAAEIGPYGLVVVARCASSFVQRFGKAPSYELSPGSCPNSPDVPDLSRYTAWGRGSFGLANGGDEVLLLGPDDALLDSVAFGSGDYVAVGLAGEAVAAAPLSLHRLSSLDAGDMSLDFGREPPTPGLGLELPLPPTARSVVGWGGRLAYLGDLHAHSSYSDGAGPPELAFARARAAGLDFYAITDHDRMLRPLEWARLRAAAAGATVPAAFVAIAGFEWSHPSQGHVNVLGVPLLGGHDSPATADLAGLYAWLAGFPLAVGQFNHPSLGGAYGGSQPFVSGREVALLEVANGSGGSKAQRLFEEQLLESWRNGWLVAPTFGSDTHDYLWGADTAARTGIWADALDEASLLSALRARRVFAAEDADLVVGWRCGEAWMGSELASLPAGCLFFYSDAEAEPGTVELRDADGLPLSTWSVASGQESAFVWPAGAVLAWIRVVQPDGDLAWTAPIRLTVRG